MKVCIQGDIIDTKLIYSVSKLINDSGNFLFTISFIGKKNLTIYLTSAFNQAILDGLPEHNATILSITHKDLYETYLKVAEQKSQSVYNNFLSFWTQNQAFIPILKVD